MSHRNDDTQRASLDVVAVASGGTRHRTFSAAGLDPAEQQQRARKRSRQIHDTQVACDYFSEQDLAHNYKPPTDLISRMHVNDLYDDVYKDKIDVSFSNLPAEKRYEMLETLAGLSSKVDRHIVKATVEEDPTAICVPATHLHDVMEIPTENYNCEPFECVKDGHLAELQALHASEIVETFATECECYGNPTMTVEQLLQELDACLPHGIQRLPHRGEFAVIMELGRRDVFYAAIVVQSSDELIPPVTDDADGFSDYVSLAGLEVAEKISAKRVTYKRRFYFECPCV